MKNHKNENVKNPTKSFDSFVASVVTEIICRTGKTVGLSSDIELQNQLSIAYMLQENPQDFVESIIAKYE